MFGGRASNEKVGTILGSLDEKKLVQSKEVKDRQKEREREGENRLDLADKEKNCSR